MEHHGAALRDLGSDTDHVRQLNEDWRSADLSAEDRAMMAYAEKLTRAPATVDEGDVETLREAGFGDRAILDICQVVSYFNFVNRTADGLGVALEGD